MNNTNYIKLEQDAATALSNVSTIVNVNLDIVDSWKAIETKTAKTQPTCDKVAYILSIDRKIRIEDNQERYSLIRSEPASAVVGVIAQLAIEEKCSNGTIETLMGSELNSLVILVQDNRQSPSRNGSVVDNSP